MAESAIAGYVSPAFRFGGPGASPLVARADLFSASLPGALAGPGVATTAARSDILAAAFVVTQSGVSNQPIVQCSPGPVSVTTTAGGAFTVTYPMAFPTACDALILSNSDDVTHPNIALYPADTGGALGRGATVCRAWQADTGAVLNTIAIKYVYVAFGH